MYAGRRDQRALPMDHLLVILLANQLELILDNLLAIRMTNQPLIPLASLIIGMAMEEDFRISLLPQAPKYSASL